MKKYICTVCEYIYDPEQGDPESGIEPGTAFEDIPDDSGKKISSRTKDKTKGENLLRGNGRIQIVSGYFYFFE